MLLHILQMARRLQINRLKLNLSYIKSDRMEKPNKKTNMKADFRFKFERGATHTTDIIRDNTSHSLQGTNEILQITVVRICTICFHIATFCVVDCVWNVMAHAQKIRFRLSAKRMSPFHRQGGGGSVQSTTGSRGVRISSSNAGYTMFWGSVKGTGYPLHLPVSPSTSASPCAITFQLDSTHVAHLWSVWFSEQ